ncbi:hypothetical protein K1719_024393 [Acacia pycnantha]|nr:hypothetical protein K1719_024393 [Acacia pycnantha]
MELKAFGILLASNFNAKLSDFSLARAEPSGDKSHVSTSVMATYGYVVPKYIATDDCWSAATRNSKMLWAFLLPLPLWSTTIEDRSRGKKNVYFMLMGVVAGLI